MQKVTIFRGMVPLKLKLVYTCERETRELKHMGSVP